MQKYDVFEIKRQKKNFVTRFVTSIITQNLVHSFKNETRNQTQLPTVCSERYQIFKEINFTYSLRNKRSRGRLYCLQRTLER